MKFIKYLREVFVSSLPLLIIIFIVTVIAFPFPNKMEYVKLSVGYVSVIIGQAIFLVGLDSSILPIGKLVGGSVTKLNKTIFILLFGFLFGLLATAAEPAISVLAGQVAQINPAINAMLFVWLVSFGTGVAIAFAIYRIIKNIDIRKTFFVLYLLIFIVVFFVHPQYRALAFDASGATTGDISVPFILALGMGISRTASKTKASDESFGVVGIASVGSIITVFIYGLIVGPQTDLNQYLPGETIGLGGVILNNLATVAMAVIPIIAIFMFFQFFFIKLPKRNLVKILASSVIVFVGLLIFLVGIDYGFAYAGSYIGEVFVGPNARDFYQWFLIPIGFVLGFAITLSEPAVVVLGEQVEELTNGHLKKQLIKFSLALSIGIASVLAIVRILFDVNILYFLVPLYAVALGLLFFTPKLFVGLAFDSGGVTGGAITSAFLTPLTLGVSQELGQDILTSGLGMIAFISVTPIIIIQILGILYQNKINKAQKATDFIYADELSDLLDEQEAPHELSENIIAIQEVPLELAPPVLTSSEEVKLAEEIEVSPLPISEPTVDLAVETEPTPLPDAVEIVEEIEVTDEREST